MQICNRYIVALACFALCFSYSRASAEAVRLAHRIVVDVQSRDHNVLRANVQVSRDAPYGSTIRYAMKAIALKGKERNFPRIAVTKVSDCGTMTMNGIPLYQTCRVLAQLVQLDEEAIPEGKRKVEYVLVDDVLRAEIPQIP